MCYYRERLPVIIYQQLRYAFLSISILIGLKVHTQEMLGVVFSEYSGISSVQVNPALMTGSRVYLDINLVGANAFTHNTMYYFPKEYNTLWNLVSSKGGYNISEGGRFVYDRTFTYFDNSNEKYFVTDNILLGPSMMLQKGSQAFGITTALRTVHSAINVPYEIPLIAYDETFANYHRIEFDDYNFSFASMTWGEIGLSYANDLYSRFNNKLTIGVSAKVLLGYEGAYAATENLNYMLMGNHTINVFNYNGQVAYSLPMSYEDPDETDVVDFKTEPLVKGLGFGFDLGFVYTKTLSPDRNLDRRKLCAQPFNPYRYKIGISLIDLGGVKFSKHAAIQSFDDVDVYWQQFDTVTFRGIDASMEMLSEVFYGDSTASYSGSKFSIGLPTTISLQFDYLVRENIYVAAIWTQPVIFNLHSLWRPSVLALIPRYENRFVGVSLPVSLINYKKPVLGIALRIYSLTIGTEMLTEWMGISDLTGADIYFTLKLNLDKGRCLDDGWGACHNADFGRKNR